MRANSSGGGIKALFLQHIEKVVLGIAMVLVALFLWSATGVKPIDATKSPEALKKGAEEQIARIPIADAPAISPLRNFEKSVEAGLTPIEEVSLYAHSTKINPDIQPAIIKRADPTLFAVEDLRVAATVISVPEEGITPTLTDTAKENEKKKTLKKAVKKKSLDGEEPQSRRRVRRSQPGYGAPSKMGYGQSSSQLSPEALPPPHVGGRGGRRGRGGESADTSSSTPGYGQPGVGYGATMVSAGPHPGAQVAQQEGAKGEVRLAVVVTGRVPYSKQFEEYQKRFKEAATFDGYSPEMDVPKYLLFKVERQEVTATGATEWKALDLDAREKLEVNWIAQAEEMVDPIYIYGNEQAPNILAWPMPPAIQRDWRRLQTHPSVPMAWMDMEELKAGSMKREWDETQTRRIKSLPPGAGYEDGRGGRMPFGIGSGPENYTDVPQTPVVPHYLFRFVDFEKLEPGKQYRYRVSLELENPNYMVPPALLENAASTGQGTIWTPPVESPVVAAESDRQLLALSTKGNWPDREATFMFHAFDKKMGAEIAKEFDLKLGGIADFVATVENWYNIYTAAGEKVENYQFRFEEGAPMLADVDGGGTLPGGGSIKQPAEMLFIDAQGRLFTSNQATDAATAEFYKERYTLVPEATETSGPNILEDAGPAAPFGGRR